MKSMSLLLLGLSLFLFVGCDSEDAAPGTEGFDAAQCTDKAANCGVDWYVSFNSTGFPENAQIVFNGKVIIDECDPRSYWSMSSTSQTVEYKITDYANLDGTQKISMAIYDRLTCNGETKVLKDFRAEQTYSVESSGGVKKITIRRN